MGVREQLVQGVLVDDARGRRRPILVVCSAGVAEHPVIDERVPGTCIEGDERAVCADPGDVGNSADIDDRDRSLGYAGYERAVVGWGERSPLAAMQSAARISWTTSIPVSAANRAPSPICTVNIRAISIGMSWASPKGLIICNLCSTV
jgi:hypothetical protein